MPGGDRGAEIRVQKLDYLGQPGYAWSGGLIERDAEKLVLEARFTHARRDLGYTVLEPGDLFVEFYYFDRWFNVFQIFAPDGRLKGWYCNIGTPARCEDGLLTYRDLALDLWAWPDGRYLVLDREEFEEQKRTIYRPEDAAAAEAGLAELISWVETGRMPSRAPRPEG